MEQSNVRAWVGAYRTPLVLVGVFVVLIAVFAITPDPTSANSGAPQVTSEPTPGPHECVICAIDKVCSPGSGQCVFVDHTPLPCVKSAKFDDKAGFCLPSGAPPAPVVASSSGSMGEFPPGIVRRSREPRQPRARNNNGSVGNTTP